MLKNKLIFINMIIAFFVTLKIRNNFFKENLFQYGFGLKLIVLF